MRRSRTGKPFAWIECSDASGDFEVTAFSEVLNVARDLLEPGMLLLLGVVAEERDGEVRLTCEAARRLDAAAAQTTSQLRIQIAHKEALGAVCRRLKSIKPPTAQEAGDVIVTLRLAAESGALPVQRDVEINIGERAACTPGVRGALRTIEGVIDVELV